MQTQVTPASRVQAERTISLVRLVLAAVATLAIWLDPSSLPAQYAGVAVALYGGYLAYAALLALWTLRPAIGNRFSLLTHGLDIVAFAALQYLTLGPSSPFYVYFVFSMFCGAIRWGWRGTLATGVLVLTMYGAMAAGIAPALDAASIEANRFLIRFTYLAVSTGLLVYLGRYEARLRHEMERLARWPTPLGGDADAAAGRMLAYGAQILNAGCASMIWRSADEAPVRIARWTPGGTSVESWPTDIAALTADPALAEATFIAQGPPGDARQVLVRKAGSPRFTGHGVLPLAPGVLDTLAGTGLVSAAFPSNLIRGRAFFSAIDAPAIETALLAEVVTREIASSLEHLHSAQQRQAIATREDRLRVARDLHDGVLQGLTGVRLELRDLANLRHESPTALRERLVSLERALAMEQRELRYFISGLEPHDESSQAPVPSLAARLDQVRDRLALEWKTPVTLRVAPLTASISGALEDAIPLMVHEATVNALKHAQPSRVSVEVEAGAGQVRILVADDGCGFPFKGRFSHAALAESRLGPRSLFERVSAMGGQLSIDSSDGGSRVQMVLSL